MQCLCWHSLCYVYANANLCCAGIVYAAISLSTRPSVCLSVCLSVCTGTVWGLRAVGAKDGSGELVNVYCENFNMIQVGLPLLVSNVFCPVSHEGCTRPAKGTQEFYDNDGTVVVLSSSG